VQYTAGAAAQADLFVIVCAVWCCRFIKDKYKGPDKSRIWLFGLSRGAYTVRAVAGMINNCGIIKKDWAGAPVVTTGCCKLKRMLWQTKPDSLTNLIRVTVCSCLALMSAQ
jgi:uncharacterized protein (DUF2235 family)